MNLKTQLFKMPAGGIAIKCLGNGYKVGMKGIAGVGISSERPSGISDAPKLSMIMKCVDALLVDDSIRAMTSKDGSKVYIELTDTNEELYAEKGFIRYLNNSSISSGSLIGKIVPFFVMALVDMDCEQLRNNLYSMSTLYEKMGMVNQNEAFAFCDDFYYRVAKKLYDGEIAETESDEYEEVVKAAIRSGELCPITGTLAQIRPNISTVELATPDFVESTPSATSETEDSTLLSECMDGKYDIDYEWSEEGKSKIPPKGFLNDFIPSQVFYDMVNKIKFRLGKCKFRMDMGFDGAAAIEKDFVNVFFTGRPGTGKTTIAYALGAALGLPVYTCTNNKHTEEDNFQGKDKTVEGKLDFVPTEFLKGFTEGGIIVLEEINLSDAGIVMGALGQAIEAPFILERDGYDIVHRHPMCVIINTMNTGTEGSRATSQAYSSRSKQSFMIDDPKDEDFIKYLMASGDFKESDCKKVFKVYKKVLKYLLNDKISADDIALAITTRQCIGALQNMEEGMTFERAIETSIVGKISEFDTMLCDDVKKIISMDR